jgi:ABC-type transport system involved in multi-copper enzyme maturation permease subunit
MIDALRYEWVRLRTIRSTYWLIGIALAFQLFMAILIGALSGDDAGGADGFAVLVTIGASTGFAPLFVAYVMGMLGVFAMGHEYRHGMIRATLTAVPQRWTVLAAKSLLVAVVSGACALACVVIAILAAGMFSIDLPGWGDILSIAAGTTIFTILFSLSGLAYATITRNQTGAVALLLLVPTIVEGIIKSVILAIHAASDDPTGKGGGVWLLKYLPYDSGGQMYTRRSLEDLLEIFGVVPFGPVGGGIVMGTFVALLLAVGSYLFLRRDA